jgi:hypothetical protein
VVSTRALYGNYEYRPPFPRLKEARRWAESEPERVGLVDRCSVCETPLAPGQGHAVWLSLRVATDVLPLLVNACSMDCIERLPTPPEEYVREPHTGGLELRQPRDSYGG